MGRPHARAALTLLLCLAAGAERAQASPHASTACAPCKSLLAALQRKVTDGWAREQLLSACAAQPEAQVRHARAAAPARSTGTRAAGASSDAPRLAPR